ncbi:MAG TPA: hypothetical protein ENN46_04620 [Candidatus Woesearchaeota archaeon]|nr:hypothetical protein [Candidatus Woesearchaeota archaeon]
MKFYDDMLDDFGTEKNISEYIQGKPREIRLKLENLEVVSEPYRSTPIKRNIGPSESSGVGEFREVVSYSGFKRALFSGSFDLDGDLHKIAGNYIIRDKKTNKVNITSLKKGEKRLAFREELSDVLLEIVKEFLRKEEEHYHDEKRPSEVIITFSEGKYSSRKLIGTGARQKDGTYLITRVDNPKQ